eukprot:358808-Chlamydomonas_euryale.AAC.4
MKQFATFVGDRKLSRVGTKVRASAGQGWGGRGDAAGRPENDPGLWRDRKLSLVGTKARERRGGCNAGEPPEP